MSTRICLLITSIYLTYFILFANYTILHIIPFIFHSLVKTKCFLFPFFLLSFFLLRTKFLKNKFFQRRQNNILDKLSAVQLTIWLHSTVVFILGFHPVATLPHGTNLLLEKRRTETERTLYGWQYIWNLAKTHLLLVTYDFIDGSCQLL